MSYELLNEFARPVKGSSILLLALAYKANVDDCRESPTFRIMELLENKGVVVHYNDPHVPQVPASRAYARFAGR